MLIDRLNWRYATKKYDPARKVSAEKFDRILQAIQLAPTSSGLQPFEVIRVTNPELREKIRAVGFDQAQFVDAAEILVFAAWDNYTDARIDGVVSVIAEQRGGDSSSVHGYYDMLKGMYLPRSAEVNFQHAARQAYVALGLGLTAAAFEEVDATPMEGFDADKVDEILGLQARGLRSVVVMALGYRAEEGDWLAGLKKVRRPLTALMSEAA